MRGGKINVLKVVVYYLNKNYTWTEEKNGSTYFVYFRNKSL